MVLRVTDAKNRQQISELDVYFAIAVNLVNDINDMAIEK